MLFTVVLMLMPLGAIQAKPKWINELELMYPISPPGTPIGDFEYQDIEGGLAPGFTLYYDESLEGGYEYYYLWIKTLDPLPDEGEYPFYLTVAPKGPFLEYWAGRGVTADATEGTWNAHMWKIINGEEPMFYLTYTEPTGPFTFGGTYLIDGLMNDYFDIPQMLRIDGTYFVGTYKFLGYPELDGQPMKTMITLFFKNP